MSLIYLCIGASTQNRLDLEYRMLICWRIDAYLGHRSNPESRNLTYSRIHAFLERMFGQECRMSTC